MRDTVTFFNPGELDVRAVTTFGLHAKPNTETPIGHFGTGLKYALAALARLEQRVTISTGGETYELTVSEDEFRGKQFRKLALHCAGSGETIPLPFTTELGKHWEPWMMYRELYCNALDEGGGVSCGSDPDDQLSHTMVVVTGAEMPRVHADRRKYFVDPSEKPLDDLGEVVVVSRPGVFRRGVRVSDGIYYPTVLGYDIRGGELDLTEDRTLKHHWQAEHVVARAIARSERPETIRQALAAPECTFERAISWHGIPPDECGDQFRTTLLEMVRTRPDKLSQSGRTLASKILPFSEIAPAVELRPPEQAALDRAVAFLRRRGVAVDQYPIVVVETLGENIHGLARDGTVYLSRATFEPGVKYVASTIYEEFVHLSREYSDCSRALQNHLLNALFTAWEEIDGGIL